MAIEPKNTREHILSLTVAGTAVVFVLERMFG